MVSVPSFLLRRLYRKNSLMNTTGGFEFELKNGLGSGYAHKMWPIKLDMQEIPTDSTFFFRDDQEIAFNRVSKENTFSLPMNKTITIWIDGITLTPGTHKIEMSFDVPGLGTLQFDFTDVVVNE